LDKNTLESTLESTLSSSDENTLENAWSPEEKKVFSISKNKLNEKYMKCTYLYFIIHILMKRYLHIPLIVRLTFIETLIQHHGNLNAEIDSEYKPMIHGLIEEHILDIQTVEVQNMILNLLEHSTTLSYPIDLNTRTIYGYSLFNVILHGFTHYDEPVRIFIQKIIQYGGDINVESHRLYPIFPIRRKCTIMTAFLVHLIHLFDSVYDSCMYKNNIKMTAILASHARIMEEDIVYCMENKQEEIMYLLLHFRCRLRSNEK
jgi:hypothetical protein